MPGTSKWYDMLRVIYLLLRYLWLYLVLRYLSQYESSIDPIFGTLLTLGPGEHEFNRGGEWGGDNKYELVVVHAEVPLDTPAMLFGPIPSCSTRVSVFVVTQQSFSVTSRVGVCSSSSS